MANAPILGQRMRPFGEEPPPVVGSPPVVYAVAVQSFVVEGNAAKFKVYRTQNTVGACSVKCFAQSDAGIADISGANNILVMFASGETEKTVTIGTVRRSGAQGNRNLYLGLYEPTGCIVRATNSTGSCEIRDYDGSVVPWFKDRTMRSGRLWASGPGYFRGDLNGRSAWLEYNKQVALCDAWTNSNFGNKDARVATWQLCAGGPKDDWDTITNGSQFSFSGNGTGWCTQWNEQIVNSCWMGFVCDLWPVIYNTDESSISFDGYGILDEIIAGDHDNWFKGMGYRMAAQCEAKGVEKRLILWRPFHEMQQTNYYRIAKSVKGKWKSANERIIDKIREGADFEWNIGFSPSKERAGYGGDLGTIESWMPSNVSFITPSFHPGALHTTKNQYLRYINGDSNWYGLDDFAEAADKAKIPMAFLEWSPRYETCLYADEVYAWFYDEWLSVNHAKVICDTVFNKNTLIPSAADAEPKQTAVGRQAWRDGVTVFKTKWGGTKGNGA